LCCIARLGTFQAAADHMHITQPAISTRIRELETRLGFPIFQKRGRNMELTMRGRELVRRIDPLLAAVKDTVLSLENPGAATGLVRIGISEILGFTWFPKLINAARRVMPRLSYEVSVGLTEDTQRDLENGKFDLVFLAIPLDAYRFKTCPVGLMNILWVGAPSEVGKKGNLSELDWRELITHHPIWSLSKDSVLYPRLREILEREQFSVGVDSCDNVLTMVQLIVAGTGIGILPEALVKNSLRDGSLVEIRNAPRMPSLQMQAAWHADRDQFIIQNLVDIATLVSTFPKN
ncbi:MAG: LysR family transcriptional regulator, partial [Deltaproteobacteria bacterium]|nr:LysR family transcriptional regulator [Deltaproteobacteria bacterium]